MCAQITLYMIELEQLYEFISLKLKNMNDSMHINYTQKQNRALCFIFHQTLPFHCYLNLKWLYSNTFLISSQNTYLKPNYYKRNYHKLKRVSLLSLCTICM